MSDYGLPPKEQRILMVPRNLEVQTRFLVRHQNITSVTCVLLFREVWMIFLPMYHLSRLPRTGQEMLVWLFLMFILIMANAEFHQREKDMYRDMKIRCRLKMIEIWRYSMLFR